LRDQSGLGQEVSDPSLHRLSPCSVLVENLTGLSLSGNPRPDEEEVERLDGLLQGRGAYARSRPPVPPFRACYIAKHENPAAGPSFRRGAPSGSALGGPGPGRAKTVSEGARGRQRR